LWKKIKTLMIELKRKKRKEKEGNEGRTQLSGQWKVPMFGGQ
jgi:hypothetical protein